MARELKHALTGATYSIDDATGLVRIQHGDKVGLFTAQGAWQSGDPFDADVHMCGWVGGPGGSEVMNKPFKEL